LTGQCQGFATSTGANVPDTLTWLCRHGRDNTLTGTILYFHPTGIPGFGFGQLSIGLQRQHITLFSQQGKTGGM
jgi:hypothetical protein